MGRHTFFAIMALAFAWLLLTETFSWQSLAFGLFMAVFVVNFSDRFLPPVSQARTVKFSKLILYPFYVIGQVYKSGFAMLKLIFVGANVDIVPVKTTLKSEILRTILADTITFIPGSISMELRDEETIMVLWIYEPKTDRAALGEEGPGVILRTGAEKRLAKADVLAFES